jgi:transposase
VDTLTAAGDKGLSKQEVTDLFNEHHATKKATATVYGWLTKLVAKGEVEQPPGPKRHARYYAKGYAPH